MSMLAPILTATLLAAAVMALTVIATSLAKALAAMTALRRQLASCPAERTVRVRHLKAPPPFWSGRRFTPARELRRSARPLAQPVRASRQRVAA